MCFRISQVSEFVVKNLNESLGKIREQKSTFLKKYTLFIYSDEKTVYYYVDLKSGNSIEVVIF